jgi:hypothetical protein
MISRLFTNSPTRCERTDASTFSITSCLSCVGFLIPPLTVPNSDCSSSGVKQTFYARAEDFR